MTEEMKTLMTFYADEIVAVLEDASAMLWLANVPSSARRIDTLLKIISPASDDRIVERIKGL